MKPTIGKKITVAAIVAVSALAFVPCQGQTQKSTSPKTKQSSTSSHSGHMGSSMSSTGTDAMFLKKLAEGNQAEIMTGQIALQKASSDRVKEFAQQMIDQHTVAQQKSVALMPNHNGSTMGNNTDMGSGNTSMGSPDTANVSGNSSTRQNNASGSNTGVNSNMDDRSGKSMNNPDTMSMSGNHGMTGSNMSSMAMMDSVELSAEHKAIQSRLMKLSGAEFDKEYMAAMVKDHAKTVALFENEIKTGKDPKVVAFAKDNIAMIRQHHQMAKTISASLGSASGSSSKMK
jgi:predicted outer membrane protein